MISVNPDLLETDVSKPIDAQNTIGTIAIDNILLHKGPDQE